MSGVSGPHQTAVTRDPRAHSPSGPARIGATFFRWLCLTGMSAEREHLLDAVAGGEDRAFARLAGPLREELRCFAVRMVGGDAGLGEEEPQQLSPARIHSEARRALRECVMGHRISKKLSGDALLYASRNVPEDAREYTECEQVLRRTQLGRPLSGGGGEPARERSRPRRPRPQGARPARSHGRP